MVKQIHDIPKKSEVKAAQRAAKVESFNRRVQQYDAKKVPSVFYMLVLLLLVGSILTYAFSGEKPLVDLESFLTMLGQVKGFDLQPIMKAMTIDTPFDWLDNILNIFTGVGKIAIIFTAGMAKVLEICFYFLKYLITGA